MTKNAIILHGKPDKDEYYSDQFPSSSNFQWIPWLQKQLLMADIPTATPEVPYAYYPQYDLWKREFERYDITPETMLVGHSCGGGFLVRWLSENPKVKVAKVVLVAPWIDPDREETDDFFDFDLNPNIADQTSELILYETDNDFPSVMKSVQLLKDKLNNVTCRMFKGYGHFIVEMKEGMEEFPELRDELLEETS